MERFTVPVSMNGGTRIGYMLSAHLLPLFAVARLVGLTERCKQEIKKICKALKLTFFSKISRVHQRLASWWSNLLVGIFSHQRLFFMSQTLFASDGDRFKRKWPRSAARRAPHEHESDSKSGFCGVVLVDQPLSVAGPRRLEPSVRLARSDLFDCLRSGQMPPVRSEKARGRRRRAGPVQKQLAGGGAGRRRRRKGARRTFLQNAARLPRLASPLCFQYLPDLSRANIRVALTVS